MSLFIINKKKRLPLEKIQIPDLWHIANSHTDADCRQAVLDTWHLAHSMLEALRKLTQSDIAMAHKCERCGHGWTPRQSKIRICPKCKSPYWDVPKQKKATP